VVASGAGTMDVYLQIWGYWGAGAQVNDPTSSIFGVSPNYAMFDADGTLRLFGNATTYKDELYALVGQRLESPASDLALNLAEASVTFENGARITDYVTMDIQLNHDWAVGTPVYPHLHWWQASATLPNWLIQYRWQVNGGTKTTAWTSAARASEAFTYSSGTLNQITKFPTITPPSGSGLSDILQVRIIRDKINTSGLFGGSDGLAANVDAVSFDIHKKIDGFGSNEEYVK
jgi:hypothetical protein